MRCIKAKEKTNPHAQIAIVVSQFNLDITEKLLEGALQRLKKTIEETAITVVWVPGAIEIGVIAKHLAKNKAYRAIICLAAIIQGETDHYHYVCQQVSYACQKVALDTHIPVIFGVLTTKDEQQAQERSGNNHYTEHGNKGYDAADAAIQMISIIEQI